MSHINYASTIWDGCAQNHLKRLKSLYRRAIKNIITGNYTTDQKIENAHLLHFEKHLKYNKCLFVYKTIYGKTPNTIKNLFFKFQNKKKKNPHN